MSENGGLRQLQDELKREYLLLEREQREKMKIKKLIETTIQDYYSALIEKKGLGRVISEDKLGNSYNFVKDLILNISKDVVLGVEVLTKCPLKIVEKLTNLLLGMFYENFSENDPYIKKSTKFGEVLGRKIAEEVLETNFMKEGNNINLKQFFSNKNLTESTEISTILLTILKKFVELESTKEYFEMLANRALNKIPSSVRFENLMARRGTVENIDLEEVFEEYSRSLVVSPNANSSFISDSSNEDSASKIDEIIEDYKLDILSKAEMMPMTLRNLCFSIFESLMNSNKKLKEETVYEFIWEILKKEYFRPFDSNTLNVKKLNMFKNSCFGDIVERILDEAQLKMNETFIHKVVQKVINMSKEKFIQKEGQSEKKITINGGCISYENLYLLFQVIKEHDKHLKTFNERVTNRVNKIFEMSPNFDSFKSFKEANKSYLVFIELNYGKVIEKDYQSMYNSVYNDNMIRNMLKQILSDTSFHILPYIQKDRSLKDILELISREQETEGDGNFSLGVLQHTAQFNMKIKYLVFLMKKEEINEENLFKEMIDDCRERQANNLVLFENNKMELLQCLTSVNKSKEVVEKQKDEEKKVDSHLKIVKTLDILELKNLCISAPSTRERKLKLSLSEAEAKGIVILNTNTIECPHKDDLGEVSEYHPTSVHSLLNIYCSLKEVSESMETGKDSKRVYESLSCILGELKSQCIGYSEKQSIVIDEYNSIEKSVFKVIMREIHTRLIENKEESEQDLKLKKIIDSLSDIKQNKFKINGKHNFSELDQVWEIACRYFKSLNEKKNPIEKMNSLLEMIEIIKISLHGDNPTRDRTEDKKIEEIVIAYCIVKSKPSKILMNIKENFPDSVLYRFFCQKISEFPNRGMLLKKEKMQEVLFKIRKNLKHFENKEKGNNNVDDDLIGCL